MFKIQHLVFSRFPPYVTSRRHRNKAVSFDIKVFSYDFWQFERDVTKSGNEERGTGNRERGSGNDQSAVSAIKLQNGGLKSQ